MTLQSDVAAIEAARLLGQRDALTKLRDELKAEATHEFLAGNDYHAKPLRDMAARVDRALKALPKAAP